MSFYRNMGTLGRGPIKTKMQGRENEDPSDDEERMTDQMSMKTSASSDADGDTVVMQGNKDKGDNKDKQDNKNKRDEGSSLQSAFSLTPLQTIILAVVIICCAIPALPMDIPIDWPAKETPSKSNSQTEFFEEMGAIVNMLKDTESNLVFVNRSLTVFMKEGNHEKPAIVLLLSSNSSSCSLCHILRMFINALCTYYGQEYPEPNKGYIKADDVRNGNEGKLYIEDNIENVAKNGMHVVIMEDIDKFPVSSLPKIHSYLDHENPPHGGMVYILTGVTADDQGEFQVQKYKELNRIATNHFDHQWLDYNEDHRRALMGRITSFIGYIHRTKKLNINEQKCEHKCEM